MGLFTGKKGVIMGVANERSIAAAVAKVLAEEGAELAFSYISERMEPKVRKIAESLGSKFVHQCDVTSDDEIHSFFGEVHRQLGKIDFLVHSIAFAPGEDLKGPTLNVTREGFKLSMDISCYSLIATTRAAAEIFNEGAAVAAMTYIGGERVVGGYNLMGVCKAALDATVKYLAFDLGPRNIRVNGVSAGPVRTLASAGIGDFKSMLELNARVAPLGRNITPAEVARATAYLLSDWSSAVTGEIHHVDCGYHVMGSPGNAFNDSKDG